MIVVLVGGCAQTKAFFSGKGGSDSSGQGSILGAPEAEHYLAELYDLAASDPATKAEIFADAQAGAQLTPGPQTNLRFALVLATAGHPESDPEQAQSLLRELLTQIELMTAAEISLATIHLNAATTATVAATSPEISASTGIKPDPVLMLAPWLVVTWALDRAWLWRWENLQRLEIRCYRSLHKQMPPARRRPISLRSKFFVISGPASSTFLSSNSTYGKS